MLEAGDALYLPPRIAHHGVSLDEVRVSYVFFRGFSFLGLGCVVDTGVSRPTRLRLVRKFAVHRSVKGLVFFSRPIGCLGVGCWL